MNDPSVVSSKISSPIIPVRSRKIDVVATAFARPKLLEGLAASLAAQDCLDKFDVRFYLFQDSVVRKDGFNLQDPELSKESAEVFARILPKGTILTAQFNLGIVGNFERILNHCAMSEADYFIFVEEDLILSKSFIEVTVDLIEKCSVNPFIGFVSAVSDRVRMDEDIATFSNRIVPLGHKWSFGISKRLLIELFPHFQVYFQVCREASYFCNGYDTSASVSAVLDFLNTLASPGSVGGAGPDGFIDVLCANLYYYNVCTYVSFGRSVGKIGAHFREELYDAMKLNEIKIFEGPNPDFQIPSAEEIAQTIRAHRSRYILDNLQQKYK